MRSISPEVLCCSVSSAKTISRAVILICVNLVEKVLIYMLSYMKGEVLWQS